MKLCWIFLAMFCASRVLADDWPQWRGPHRNGISRETIATTCPAEGPKLLWRASVGKGFSSVAVSKGRVFTMGNERNEDTVWCLDARTGRPVWQHTYAAQLSPQWYEGGPGATPTVDGGRVFTISKWGDVFCFDAAKGTILWQRDLRQDGIKPNRWGFAGSPLIWRDLVILNAGTAGVALERKTGRLVWSNGTNAAGYASPVRFESGDKDEVLIFAAKNLVALDPETGRERWRQFWETGWDTNNSDPLIQAGRIFLSSFDRGCGLLAVQGDRPQFVYTNAVMHSHLSPGVLLGEFLYAFNGEAKQETDFRCIHVPTGELKWTRPDPPFGSLIAAGDNLLILSEKGELLMAKASPKDFIPIARAKVIDGRCWTPPALANGVMYIRNARGELLGLAVSP